MDAAAEAAGALIVAEAPPADTVAVAGAVATSLGAPAAEADALVAEVARVAEDEWKRTAASATAAAAVPTAPAVPVPAEPTLPPASAVPAAAAAPAAVPATPEAKA